MSRIRHSLVIVIALGSAEAARGDLSPAVGEPSASSNSFVDSREATVRPAHELDRPIVSADFSGDSTSSAHWPPDPWIGSTFPDMALPTQSFSSKCVQTTDRVVRELPAAPGSAALFLSAMMSIGAWQLVRSSRDIHLGALPEWYHAGGPVQIGHATPFDLDFSSLPLCCFEQPVAQRPALVHHLREFPSRMVSQQYFLTNADPRGPPVLS